MKEKIEFSEFLELEKKLEIKVGTILLAEEVPKSNKLLKLTVKFDSESRIVVTNIKQHLVEHYGGPTGIVNKNFLFITNLKPVVMMGIESTAMILPGDLESNSLLFPTLKRVLITVNGESGTNIL